MPSLTEKKQFINDNKKILSDPEINNLCVRFLTKYKIQTSEPPQRICDNEIDPDEISISEVNILYNFLQHYQSHGFADEFK